MTVEKVKNRILEFCSHFTFEYDDKICGIDPYNFNEFDMWYGENVTHTASSIDEVMNKPFFDGKSLTQIADEIKIIDW